MRRVRGRLTYANVVATIALFLALGAATAFAATQLAKNSVGTKQIRNGAVTPTKLSKLAKAAFTGSRAPEGRQGPKGEPGARGVIGPAGPTAAAQGGGSSPPPSGGEHSGTLSFATATLTSTAPGSVFVVAEVPVGVGCPAGPYNCDFSIGVYLDGQPVPGSAASVVLGQNTNELHNFHLFGIATGVAAGSHKLTLGWNGDSPNPSSVTDELSEAHVAGIALGG